MAERKSYQFHLGGNALRVMTPDGEIVLRQEIYAELYDYLCPDEGPPFEYGDTLFGELTITWVHNTPIEDI